MITIYCGAHEIIDSSIWNTLLKRMRRNLYFCHVYIFFISIFYEDVWWSLAEAIEHHPEKMFGFETKNFSIHLYIYINNYQITFNSFRQCNLWCEYCCESTHSLYRITIIYNMIPQCRCFISYSMHNNRITNIVSLQLYFEINYTYNERIQV